jgi:hypothetical protein
MGSRCQGCTATPTAPRRLQPRKAKQRRHLRTQMASPSRQWRRPPGADPAPADAPAAKKKSKGRGTALEAARNKLAAAEAKLETLKARDCHSLRFSDERLLILKRSIGIDEGADELSALT